MSLFSGGGYGSFDKRFDESSGALSGLASIFKKRADAAGGYADAYRPKADSAAEQLARMLGNGTTDSERNNYIGRATADVTGNYLSAKSNLEADAARSGIDSGSTASGLATLEGARAGAYSTAANNADNYFTDRQYSRAGDLYNLRNGQFAAANNEESQNLGQEGGLLQYLSSLFGQRSDAEKQREAEKRAAEASSSNALLGALGTGAGAFFGGPAGAAIFGKR